MAPLTVFRIWPRQSGKSFSLAEWLAQAPEGEFRVVVCANQADARRMYLSTHTELPDPLGPKRFHMVSQFTPDQFVSFHLLVANPKFFRGRGNVVLAVDNLDLMLHAVFGAPVEVVTATGVFEAPGGLTLGTR